MSNKHAELDNIVKRFNFDREICPGASSLRGNAVPSDAVFDSYAGFFIKGIAAQKFGTNYGEMRMWGPRELLEFYTANLLGEGGMVLEKYELDLDHSTAHKHLLGATKEAKDTLLYRWNHGMLYTTYAERVQLRLDRMAISRASEAIKAAELIDELMSLKNGLSEAVDAVAKDPRVVKRFRAMIKSLNVSDLFPDSEE